MRKVGAAILAAGISIAFVYLTSCAFAHGVVSPRQESGDKIDSTTTTGSVPEDSALESQIQGPYAALITRYARKFGVSPELADAVVRIESHFDPRARGKAGEIGLMQIKPSTARLMGYRGSVKGLYEPETNIRLGMKYLAAAQELGDGTTCSTILKYNAGHSATHMNPISKHYCNLVLSYID